MSGIRRMLFGGRDVWFLVFLAGCYTTGKVLKDQYREDVAEIQDFYRQKLEEFGGHGR